MRIDCHVHMVGNGLNGSGCRLFLRKALRKLMGRIMVQQLGMPGTILEGNLEEAYLQRVLEWRRGSSLTHIVLLAQDWVRDGNGNALENESALYVPNDVVLKIGEEHSDILPACSIHPARADAIDELVRCHERGAIMMKCLPLHHRIDPRDKRFEAFWRKMAELKMPLLAHTGGELSLPNNAPELADPRILIPVLEQGVTVIAAHGGSSAHYFDTNYMSETAEMLRKYPNLYVDNSGLNTPIRSRHLKRMLGPEFAGRVIFGSDLPIAISPLWVRMRGWISHAGYVRAKAEKNPIERDVIIKQELGFPDETLTRLGGLLQTAAAQSTSPAR
ncbi:MAG TPA: amidohydrolase family protein [Verrucomicrobiae bacterium]|nr:amidohydrolase family protein [Verrucomicrobiae bacterium]